MGENPANFKKFLHIFKQLPLLFYLKLKTLLLYSSPIPKNSAWHTKSNRLKFIEDKIIFAEHVSELFTHKWFRRRWIDFLPNYIKEQQENMELY